MTSGNFQQITHVVTYMNKALIKNIILILGTAIIAILSLWLPGYLMQRDMHDSYNNLSEVPAGYYSGPSKTIIKNVSKQLTSQQRIQLITGQWESEIAPADEDEVTLTDLGIKTLTLIHINDLYTKGLYPRSLSSEYGKWYTWSVKPYRALDTTFRSYEAIYWEVDFDKYDNTEHHRFIVTDTGDFLYANASIQSEETNESSDIDNAANSSNTDIATNSSNADNVTDSSNTDNVTDSNNTDKNMSSDSDTTEDFSSFTPVMKNCPYLLYSFGEATRSELTNGVRVIVSMENSTTTFLSSSATDAVAKKFDSQNAVSFIENYNGFEPDGVYSISESTGPNGTYKYLVGYKKTDTEYTVLLLPLD